MFRWPPSQRVGRSAPSWQPPSPTPCVLQHALSVPRACHPSCGTKLQVERRSPQDRLKTAQGRLEAAPATSPDAARNPHSVRPSCLPARADESAQSLPRALDSRRPPGRPHCAAPQLMGHGPALNSPPTSQGSGPACPSAIREPLPQVLPGACDYCARLLFRNRGGHLKMPWRCVEDFHRRDRSSTWSPSSSVALGAGAASSGSQGGGGGTRSQRGRNQESRSDAGCST